MPSSRLVSVLSLTAAVVCGWFVSLPAQQAPQVVAQPVRRDAMAQHRAVSRRADEGGRRPSEPAVHLLHRHGERRRVEDDRRRPHLEADLRRSADRIDRLGRRSRRPIPNIVYVGSGEGLPRPDLAVGDGIYKSTDAGKTWTHLGLARRAADSARSPIDPKNPNRLFVAALGHPYGPNEERGIFRSTDGGQTFERVLFKDENTGGKDVDIDPSNPDIVYATLWEQRQGPWENGAWDGTNGGIFKSTDGGTTWKPLKQGLPDGIVNAELAIAPSNPRRLYATVEASRRRHRHLSIGRRRRDLDAQRRPIDGPTSRINEVVPHVHPKDPDTLIVTDIVSYKSTDGGKTFVPFKGAPGGDDYQNIWWNPNNPDIMLLVVDQGAVVTLNGGQTWSSWYTQPTAALYHVMTDNAFPYRVCGGQQDSGSVCVASRGNDGQITFREWHPVGVEEYGYAAPDPLDPDLVYGGKVTRYDRRTGQVSNVGPLPAGAVAAPAGRPVVSDRAHAAGRVLAQSIRTRCSTATTCSGRRSTAASTGSRSART